VCVGEKGKHHILLCFVLVLGGSREICLCPHLLISPITGIPKTLCGENSGCHSL
jgi:hypothetical protein